MSVRIVVGDSELPEELLDFKREHYQEIFGAEWESVFNAGNSEVGEPIILKNLDDIIGGCVIRRGTYSLKFKDFSILANHRGEGHARFLMNSLEKMAVELHQNLIRSGEKPGDINKMYLRSLIYLDGPGNGAFQFGNFLNNFGFAPYLPNESAYPLHPHEFSREEKAAIEVYRRLYPQHFLRVFKKPVVDEKVELRDEIKNELLRLRKDKWSIVMGGLNWKLGHYSSSGEVSYKFNICPICADMGCSDLRAAEDSSRPCPADNCYIYLACMEPFRAVGRFKEDFEVSNAYFSAMRNFLLANPPKA